MARWATSDVVVAGKLHVGRRDLDDAGHAVGLEGVHDSERHFHVGGIERREHYVSLLGDLDERVHIDEGHSGFLPLIRRQAGGLYKQVWG